MLSETSYVARYRATDGKEGHDWQGTQTLILTTIGRKSGEQRDAALIYAPRGDADAIVASEGGADAPPAWYLNLETEPHLIRGADPLPADGP